MAKIVPVRELRSNLSQLLSDCSGMNAGSIVARIQREVREFGSGPPADDTALIAFRGQLNKRVPYLWLAAIWAHPRAR